MTRSLWWHGVSPAKLLLSLRPHHETVPLVLALIATLPGEPGRFYPAVRAAVAAAGGCGAGDLRGVHKQAQDVSTIAKDGAFEKHGDTAQWPPWGTSKVRPALHCLCV